MGQLPGMLSKRKRITLEYQRENFFHLHIKFEEKYTDLLRKVNMIAEQILTLGGNPIHNFYDYT